MYETIAHIDGMMCGMCEAHVADAIRAHIPVKKVSASHAKRRAVILSEDPIDIDALHAALDPTGYKLLDVEESGQRGRSILSGHGRRRLFHRK